MNHLAVTHGTELNVERASAILADCRTTDEAKGVRDQAEAIKVYLRSRRASLEAQNAAAEISLRAERRMGEILRESLQHGRPKKGADETHLSGVRLADVGLLRKESARAQKLADVGEAEFEARIEAVKAAAEKLTTGKVMSLRVPSAPEAFDGDEYGTPGWLIDLERELMGDIDLDPASNPRSQEIVQAKRYYTRAEDALAFERDWYGRVHLNPPYSRGAVEEFVAKLLREKVEQACVLVNSSTETGWYQSLVETRFPFLLFHRRIGFLGPDNAPCDQNRYAQTMFFLGCEQSQVKDIFGHLGQIVKAI